MEELPEMPKPYSAGILGIFPEAASELPSVEYTAEQMRSYALLAVKAERERAMAAVREQAKDSRDRHEVEIIGRCWSAIRKG
jgi:hypothetical protein